MSSWLRTFVLLQSIPKAPKRIGTSALRDALAKRGFDVSLRTIQRDLNELSAAIPELGNDGNRDATGWFWRSDAPLLQLPAMDPAIALAFKLGEQYLRPQLPEAVLEPLEPYFSAASAVLDNTEGDSYRLWPERVRFVPKGQPLKAPRIEQGILRTVQDALFIGRQFRATYQAVGREPAEYLLNPLGLVYRGNVIYLVAAAGNYQNPRHFALHRFRAAEILESPAQKSEGFNLNEHVKAGHFDWSLGEDIQLVAYFYRDAANILAETPLSDDQVLEPCEDNEDWFELRATVRDTAQLQWWLLEWADQVILEAPPNIKKSLVETAQNICNSYREN